MSMLSQSLTLSQSLIICAGALVNLVSALIIIRGIYYQKEKDYNFIFTFIVFNSIIYFIMGLFTSTELSIGVGFGMFALFSVLRYRTETVPIREMTYLFVMVALPVINAIYFREGAYENLVLVNCIIIGIMWFMEMGWGFSYEVQQHVTYDRIDLIHPSRRDELYADLSLRVGNEIIRCDIVRIDYLRDVAELNIKYKEKNERLKTVDNEVSEVVR
ncbi:MAG: DUF4956 domain-containing protein [Methanomicrobiales archaeon]|nr:DUF4956 domain-containing protein [Methanomicrobiales archaeon]